MRVTIWGARGSIPTPIRPEEIREKIISALLNISKVEDDEFRAKLISAILEHVEPVPDRQSGSFKTGITSQERRRIIETYLDDLSPLAGRTASGNTPCIEIQSGKDLFIIDAGSGIRQLGNQLMNGDFGRGQGMLHLFFSHPHWDHIQGFPFFRPAYIPGNKIFIYGVHDIEMALRRQQEFISFPVPLERMHADIEFVRLEPGSVLEFSDLYIRPVLNHHPGDSYSFRFEKGNKVFVYASDSAYPTGINLDKYIELFDNADVLIFDAQFTQRESDEKEDWGHSSSFFGVEMAQRANVKNLVLFHYDPSYTDKDLEGILEDTLKFQRNQYPSSKLAKVTIAREGLTFDLLPVPTTQLKQVPGGKVAILKPTGIFNENIAAELSEQLTKLKPHSWPLQLVIDLSAVEMLQVAGLKALVKLRKEQQGAPMVLAGPSINVQQLIELAGYSDFFAIYPSVHAALNALKAHETLNLPGQTIKSRYYIEAKIGEGRLGTIFRATDTRYNRSVALKVLSASFSEGAIEQFLNQARQIINLTHPNIVSIYDCDEDRGLSFMVEEFIEGQTLRDIIDEYRDHPLPLADGLSIAERIAHGLEYAHGHDVIHGDLKPKNVLLFAQEVKISDFGLGRLESGKSLININVPLAMVSARYVAPEQILGHPIDARTDLYALGAILYELFTGQPVFTGSDEEVLNQHKNTPPRPPREINPQLSYALEHLILKLLDKDPNKRYAQAGQVRRILSSMVTFAQGTFSRQRWPAFVENKATLQHLTELWAETQQGQGQLVFISGQAGIGKTRLVHEFVQNIGEATLLIGKCQQFNNSSAYQPFVAALKTYFANTPTAMVRQQVGTVLREMSNFVPEIQQFIPDSVWDQKVRPKTSQQARTETNEHELGAKNTQPATHLSAFGLAALLKQATQEKPWLIILDDLHRADQSSLQLLQYLGRHCQDMRLMIVGIYQDTNLTNNEALQDTLEALQAVMTYTSLTLENLSKNGVKQFLEHLWSQAVPIDLVTAIYRRSGGNPFYIEEVAKGLVDDGIVSWRDNKWHFAPVVEVGLPKDAQEAILRRINRLSKETQALLHQAAVLGQTFEFSLLHEMSDLSRWDALESLDIALERQLIKEIPGEDVLRFKHFEIQQVLYRNLSQLKRQLLHREAAEALERQYSAEIEDGYAEALAYHYYEAGEFKQSLTYSRQAAAKAAAICAHQTALSWYTQALDALDQMGEEAVEAERFELLLAREQIYNQRGERQAQIADLAALQTLAQVLDDPVKQAVVHNRQAVYEQATSQFVEALTEAQVGLIAARQANQAILEVESLMQLAYIEADRGNFEAALEQAHHVQKIIKSVEDAPQVAALNNLLGIIRAGINDYEQAEDNYQQALQLNRTTLSWPAQADNLTNLGRLYITTGRYLEAESICRQALEIYRIAGHQRGQAKNLHNLALIYKELGYYQAVRQYLEQALQIRYTTEDHQGEATDLRELGTLQRITENHDKAQRTLEQALEIFQRLELLAQEAETWLELGFLWEELREWSQASQAYSQAQTLYARLKNKRGELEAKGGLARCLLAEDKATAAQKEVEGCMVWLEAHDPVGFRDTARLYMTIYRVLRANKRVEEAKQTLAKVQLLIKKRADNIDDLAVRASFMKAIPENREVSLSE